MHSFYSTLHIYYSPIRRSCFYQLIYLFIHVWINHYIQLFIAHPTIDLISAERLARMELAVDQHEQHQQLLLQYDHHDQQQQLQRSNKYKGSHDAYQYLPRRLIEDVLSRLTKLTPPLYNDAYQFHLAPGIKPIVSVR